MKESAEYKCKVCTYGVGRPAVAAAVTAEHGEEVGRRPW